MNSSLLCNNDYQQLIDSARSLHFNLQSEKAKLVLYNLLIRIDSTNSEYRHKVYSNLGMIFRNQRLFAKSMVYLDKALEQIIELDDTLAHANLMINKTAFHRDRYDPTKGLVYSDSTLFLLENFKDNKLYREALFMRSTIYSASFKFDSSLYYLNKYIKISKKDSTFNEAKYYGRLARYYHKTNQTEKSNFYISKLHNTINSDKFDATDLGKFLESMISIHESLRNYDSVLKYQYILNEFVDEYVDSNQVISDIEAKYRIEKIQNKLQIMQSEHEIATIKSNNYKYALFIIVFILLLLFYFTKRINTKSKELFKAKISLTKLNLKLESELNEKEKITAILSHNLKTPLLGMKMISEKLSKSNTEISKDDLNHKLEIINKNIPELLKISEQMINFNSTINIDKKDTFDVKDFIQDQFYLHEELAIKNDNSLELNLPNDLTVCINKSAFEIIIDNLISNSIKYSKKSSIISVSSTTFDKYLELEFRNLIEKNYQDYKKDYTSSGLGLQIVNKYLEEINGFFKMTENEPNYFSVKIFLPKN